ncbi:MAG: hypothetical protein RLZZ91_942 [Bacteroidota bacterium]|jgi:hypothetical protein
MENLEQQIKSAIAESKSTQGVDADLLWRNIATSLDRKQKTRRKAIGYWIYAVFFMIIGFSTYLFKEHLYSKEDFSAKSTVVTDLIGSWKNTFGNSGNELAQEGLANDPKKAVYLSEKNSQSDNPKKQSQLLVNSTSIFKRSQDLSVTRDDSISILGLAACSIPIDFHIISLNEKLLTSFQFNETNENSENNSLAWRGYMGPAWLDNKFRDQTTSLADDLNKDLSVETGNVFGVSTRINLGRNWATYFGIEYSNFKDRFDKVIVYDTLILINQEEIVAQNIRTIRQHNNATVISFPIVLDVFKDVNRMRLGLQIGGSYSVVIKQNGRMLKDNATVVNYSQNEKRFYNFYSARVTPYMGIQFSKKILLETSLQTGIQHHRKNSINQLESWSLSLMPTIGLIYNY